MMASQSLDMQMLETDLSEGCPRWYHFCSADVLCQSEVLLSFHLNKYAMPHPATMYVTMD
eukprot:4019808-Amphidinium_carterae.1